ncbi:MAG: hypothetical protein AAF481_01705 [Acidobacteriota bacterium]
MEGKPRTAVEFIASRAEKEPDDDALVEILDSNPWVFPAIQNLHPDWDVRDSTKNLQQALQKKSSSARIRALVVSLCEAGRKFELRRALELQNGRSPSPVYSAVATFSMIVGVIGVLMTLTADVAVGTDAAPQEFFGTRTLWLSIAHVGVIIILLASTSKISLVKKEDRDAEYIGTVAQLTKGWLGVWLLWLALYGWFTVAVLCKFRGFEIPGVLFWSVADLINIATGTAFFYLFLALQFPSVDTDRDKHRSRRYYHHRSVVLLVSLFVAGFSILGRIWTASVDSEPTIVGILGLFIQSSFVAVSMCYFFGRLDSHYLGTNLLTLAPLYAYAVIQMSWGSIGEDPQLSAPLLIFALVFKVYLYGLAFFWIWKGKLRKYLELAAEHYPQIQVERRDLEPASPSRP